MKINKFLILLVIVSIVFSICVLSACGENDSVKKETDYSKYNWLAENDFGLYANGYDNAKQFAVAQYIDAESSRSVSFPVSLYDEKAVYFFETYRSGKFVSEFGEGYAYVFDNAKEATSYCFSKTVKALFSIDTDGNMSNLKLTDNSFYPLGNSADNVFFYVALCDFSDNSPLTVSCDRAEQSVEKAENSNSISLEAGQTKVVTLKAEKADYAYIVSSKEVEITDSNGNVFVSTAETPDNGYGFDFFDIGEYTYMVKNASEEAVELSLSFQYIDEIKTGDALNDVSACRWHKFTLPANKIYGYNYYANGNLRVLYYYEDGVRYKNVANFFENTTDTDKEVAILIANTLTTTPLDTEFNLIEMPVKIGFKQDGKWVGRYPYIELGKPTRLGFYVGDNLVQDAKIEFIQDGKEEFFIEGDSVEESEIVLDGVPHKSITVSGEFTLTVKKPFNSRLSSNDAIVAVYMEDALGNKMSTVETFNLLFGRYAVDCVLSEGDDVLVSKYSQLLSLNYFKLAENKEAIESLEVSGFHNDKGVGYEIICSKDAFSKINSLATDAFFYEYEESIVTNKGHELGKNSTKEVIIDSDRVVFRTYVFSYGSGTKRNALQGASEINVTIAIEREGTFYDPQLLASETSLETVKETKIDLSNDAKWLEYVSR